MSSTSPEGSRGAPAVDTTRSYDARSHESAGSDAASLGSNGSSNGSTTAWARSAGDAPADARTDGSPLAGVTAEMRNMARSAASKAQSAASSAAQATRKAAAPSPAAAKPAAAKAAKAKGPRRVRLAVARVDPWSIMKMSFLLSVAVGIAGVVLTAVLWMILSTMNVFTDVEGVLQGLQSTTENPFSIKDYVGFGRVVSLSIVIGVIDVILMTAIATVMAFLYNIASALVGGVQLTLTDD